MDLSIVSFISLSAVIFLGIIASYTDIKYKKAYNRQLIIFLVIGIGIQIASVVLNEVSWATTFLNILLAIITSILFYCIRIWAAGDCKLYITMILLIAHPLYMADVSVYFPAFYILEFVFTLAVIYVVIESVVFICIDCKNKTVAPVRELLPKISKDTVFAWVTAFLFVDLCDALILHFGNDILAGNTNLLLIVNILVTIVFLSHINRIKTQIIISACCLILRSVLWMTIHIAFSSFSVWTLFVVAVTIVIRKLTGKYNYRLIPVSKLETGNVLAKCSLILMLPSSVKGLPQYTDETTRYRLTEDEVNAIKRWEHSKYGQNNVTIVRTVPFAPFIFGGTLMYFVFFYLLGA